MQNLDINGRPVINIGDSLTCAETGKQFTAKSDGFTFNYARDAKNNVFSDEGVNIRETRQLLDRTKPFYCYVASDGRTVGGWKGNTLGTVYEYGESRAGWNGGTIARFRVLDIHGQWWNDCAVSRAGYPRAMVERARRG